LARDGLRKGVRGPKFRKRDKRGVRGKKYLETQSEES